MKIQRFLATFTVTSLWVINSCAGTLGSGFTYQGRLDDGGAPANGSYEFIFNLYDSPTNGNAIGSFDVTGAVPVSNGLFVVELNGNGEFGPQAFNGDARWLEIGVRTNNNNLAKSWIYLSPRQPLTPAPQALFAVNSAAAATVADGAVTSSKLAPGAVQAGNLAPGALTWSNLTDIPAGFADGVDNDTIYTAGSGLTLSGLSNQFNVNFAGTGSANTAARSDHNHFGAVWGGATAFGLGLSVTNGAANSTALYGQQGTGSGFPYVFGNTAGVWGESSQGSGVFGASAVSRGVQGMSLGSQGYGVYGIALSMTGTNYGVYGKSSSTNAGAGVYGQGAVASTNPTKAQLNEISVGVVGESAHGAGLVGLSDDGNGAYGGSVNAVGVSGHSANFIGVIGQSDSSAGVGVEALNYSGVAFKAAGSGIIQSDADSVLWFPATYDKVDGSATAPHFFANGVFVQVTPSQTGATAWPMSLNLPGTLYGQNVTVKSLDVYYQCSNGARSYLTTTTVYKVKPDGTFNSSFVSGGATGNGPTSLTCTLNQQLSASEGFISVLFSAYFGNLADSIQIYGVRVVISHK